MKGLLCLFPMFLMAGDEPSLKETIEKYHAAYIQTLKQADVTGHVDLYTDSAYVINAGSPLLSGKASIAKHYQALFGRAQVLDGAIKTLKLEQSGDLAYEVGEFSYTVKVEGSDPRIIGGHYVAIWKRQADGSWRYEVDAGIPK